MIKKLKLQIRMFKTIKMQKLILKELEKHLNDGIGISKSSIDRLRRSYKELDDHYRYLQFLYEMHNSTKEDCNNA